MKKFSKKNTLIILMAGIASTSVGCSMNQQNVTPQIQEESKKEYFQPVSFTYSGMGGTYDIVANSPRQRAVTLSQFMTEMLLTLGLEDQIVATALLDNPILPEFEEAYSQIPVLQVGEGHAISKEAFIASNPDFVSGWDSSISEQTTGLPDELIAKDIIPFMAKSYEGDATVETVYEDFELLGKLFNVQDRAEEVIQQMKKDIKSVTDRVGSIKEKDRVKVMVYDSGQNDAMVVGTGLANNLIELAGGSNVFANDANRPYVNVSWESVVARNPEVILITEFMAGDSADSKISFLKKHPALKDVEAIKNNRLYVVRLADLSPGIRNPMLIEQMYHDFYETPNLEESKAE